MTRESTDDDTTVSGVTWTTLSLDELRAAYWEHVAPRLAADGFDPERAKPTHAWLREHGFRPLVYALRRYHDRSFGTFWREDLGLREASGYDWATDDERTRDALESYLDSQRERGGLSESSIRTLRYRLGRYVEAYVASNGRGTLVDDAADRPEREAVDACWAAFDRLHAELDGARTKRRIHGVVEGWYDHLVRRKWVRVNPAAGVDSEFRWRPDDGDNPRLSAAHVRALYAASEDRTERLLVLALCAWGLRSGEVAALHARNLVLDDDPFLDFDRRKNGPGQVSLLYGADVLRARVDDAGDDWNGYLFPSSRSQTGHVSRQTLLNWFDALVDRAGLPDRIGGEKPVPGMGRRFWYDAYSSSLSVILDELEAVAAEQGSSSAEVILTNYLSEERLRRLRRDHMRGRLAEAFEGGERS